MQKTVFYDPTKTFEDNFTNGPFMKLDKPQNSQGEPQHTVLGFKVHTPFGIPAGPLPTSRHVGLALDLGFDVICYKTQRTVEFKANQFPHILSLDVDGDLSLKKASGKLVGKKDFDQSPDSLTITNSFGMPSMGAEYWADDLKKSVDHANANTGQLMIMSIVGTIQDGFTDEDYYNDFAAAAKIAYDAGAPAIEVNLSCPNVSSEGVLCYTAPAVKAICQKVRAVIGHTPLVTKIGYYSPDQQEILEQVVADMSPYVQAISAINTVPATIINEDGGQALPGRDKSGCCGAGIKWAGLDMVKRLDTLRKAKGYTYEIFGVGGVMTPADYKEYIDAGADCVQSATGAMWNPHLAQEIKSFL